MWWHFLVEDRLRWHQQWGGGSHHRYLPTWRSMIPQRNMVALRPNRMLDPVLVEWWHWWLVDFLPSRPEPTQVEEEGQEPAVRGARIGFLQHLLAHLQVAMVDWNLADPCPQDQNQTQNNCPILLSMHLHCSMAVL